MEVFHVDTSSAAAIDTPSAHTDIYPLHLNRNLILNGLPNEEWNSSNSIDNISQEDGNIMSGSESSERDFSAQHNDGFPIITSVFSLVSTSSEVKRENRNVNMELIDNQFAFTPLISQTEILNTFDCFETDYYSPPASSFILKRDQDDAITEHSQTRTTEVKNQNMNLCFHNFLTGGNIIAGSGNKLSNLLCVNSMGEDINHRESESGVVDDKAAEYNIKFDSIPSWKGNPQYSTEHDCILAEQPQLVATFNKTEATKARIMREREERIHHLKSILLQKEAEVEKIRFLSKKNSLLCTIDKLKDRLSTRNDSLGTQTSFAHPEKDCEPPDVQNLDLE
jgi:hypothetical protein